MNTAVDLLAHDLAVVITGVLMSLPVFAVLFNSKWGLYVTLAWGVLGWASFTFKADESKRLNELRGDTKWRDDEDAAHGAGKKV